MATGKVIVINGAPESGKDTFVNMCRYHHDNVYNIHTSTPAKEALRDMGWNGEKTPNVRNLLKLMMDLGHESGTINAFVTDAIKNMRGDYVVFVHCREQERIDWYVKNLGAKVLFIERPDALLKEATNESDAKVTKRGADFLVRNTGSIFALNHIAQTFMYSITVLNSQGGYFV